MMAVLCAADLAREPGRAGGRKPRGLAQLAALGIATPELIVLDDSELHAWSAARELSQAARAGLKALLDHVEASGKPPLFSVRCEASSATGGVRPPPTILNIGPAGLRAGGGSSRWPALSPVTLTRAYEDRVAEFVRRHGPARVHDGEDALGALCAWVERMFEALADTIAPPVSYNLVVQRMVFGCVDGSSGNGICCNLPEPASDSRFRGVFLPGQLGVPLIRGVWGDPQVDLRMLATINPGAYRELAGIFDRLESLARDPYIEFTVQGPELFCMQYEQRRRRVVVE